MTLRLGKYLLEAIQLNKGGYWRLVDPLNKDLGGQVRGVRNFGDQGPGRSPLQDKHTSNRATVQDRPVTKERGGTRETGNGKRDASQVVLRSVRITHMY